MDSSYTVVAESLLVMSAIGVQLTTTFATGRTQSTFFDITEVKDIIINEAITMVTFYLLEILPSHKITNFTKSTSSCSVHYKFKLHDIKSQY